jgi:hypothetical protein
MKNFVFLLFLLLCVLPFPCFSESEITDEAFFMSDEDDVLDILFSDPKDLGKTNRSMQQTVISIQLQIDALQGQINSLTTLENSARTLKVLATGNVSRAKEETDEANNEYEDALPLFNAAPSNRAAQIMFEHAQKRKEDAQKIYDEENAKANIVENLWNTINEELNKERKNLAEFRELLRRLNAGEISAESVTLTKNATDALETNGQSVRKMIEKDLNAAMELFREQLIQEELLLEQLFRKQFESEFNRYRVFSVRPQFLSAGSIIGAGATAELGKIDKNGFYLTGELSAGAGYFGGLLNGGMCLNKDGFVKNVLGLSAGIHFSGVFVDFTDYSGKWLARDKDINMNFGGAFYKILIGREKNFDLIYRFMLGYRKNPTDYLKETGDFIYEKGLGMAYSLSIGYTLTKVREQK